VSYLLSYLVVVVVFLAIDAIWLKLVMRPLFERFVGDQLLASPRLGVAAGFYALYCVGIVWFAVAPAQGEGVGSAIRDGAILGFLAYGTYEATNLATLKGWDWRMAAVDVPWGMVLTALAAAAGHAVL
jgi:uncharacterized membrane protein